MSIFVPRNNGQLSAEERHEVARDALMEAGRRDRTVRILTDEERLEAERALMRIKYDEMVDKGEIDPLPTDLVGWSIGGIVVVGPGAEPHTWNVRNDAPGRPPTYDVKVEALMDAYAKGILVPPADKAARP